MVLGTHRTIAENVYLTLLNEQNIKLNRGLFIAGNMFPDLHIDYIKEKHYKSFCYEKIREAIIDLSKTKMNLKEFSFRAGIICHYLSDFFCYPHEQEWRYLKGNTKEHIIFEEKQHRITNNKIFLVKCNLSIEEFEKLYIDFFIENLLDEYRNAIDYSRDVVFAITASYKCVEALLYKMFKHNIIEV